MEHCKLSGTKEEPKRSQRGNTQSPQEVEREREIGETFPVAPPSPRGPLPKGRVGRYIGASHTFGLFNIQITIDEY